MVENEETVVKTNGAIRQFQIIDGPARKFGFGEIFQVVAPETEAAAQRKRQVNFIQNFKSRHKRIEDMPGIPELDVMRDA